MENFEHDYDKKCRCKEGCLKFATIFVGTIVGSFLSFYCLADFTFKMLLSPEHQMHRAEKMMRNMDRQMAREMDKNFKEMNKNYKDIDVVGVTNMKNPVSIIENEDAYTVMIVLKYFGNNPKNIKVSVEDENILKVEYSNEIKKGDKEKMMSLYQSYQLDKKVNENKMTTKVDKGNLIVTLPYEK